ncbi:hypothetical protein PSACC_00401 [Paramicrosporidium saccamoebae]|uniref:Uncharacterized protein n=1 Tax=Paramicrosporidium saccamoebae TaxID=1246581 RepID=A0A2H9TPT4_9FUNG|nr:hypothetical protein PSACC_00401 [Paramicrosporidium saccamoebae]
MQPFSVEFKWASKIDYHLYQIDVFDITETTDDDQPGDLTFSHYVEPSHSSPIAPKHALITGLDPERYYRLLVRPGNHTVVHPSGKELLIRTPPYYDERNLVLNGNFYLNDDYWERSLGTSAALVALRPADSLPSEVAIPARKAHHTASLHPDDYAISIYIGAGPDTPVGRGIYQTIPVDELPSECHTMACQISVSAWTRVDRLFGPPAQLSLQLRLRYVWADKVQEFYSGWDPYEETKWQPMAFSTGLVMSASRSPLVALEVWAWLVAPRGAAFFDDFYLSVRPISTDGYL